MPESCIVILDNSEHMRNGDYLPTRLEAQRDAARWLVSDITMNSPESTVGIIAGINVLVSNTNNAGQLFQAIKNCSRYSKTNELETSLQVACMALKHRRSKAGSQRIVVFCGSPTADESNFARVRKQIRKNGIALQIVVLGDEPNLELLQTLLNEGHDNIVKLPKGVVPSEFLATATTFTRGTYASDGINDYTDSMMDPDLAMALQVSLQEERTRQEERQQQQQQQQEEDSTRMQEEYVNPLPTLPLDNQETKEETIKTSQEQDIDLTYSESDVATPKAGSLGLSHQKGDEVAKELANIIDLTRVIDSQLKEQEIHQETMPVNSAMAERKRPLHTVPEVPYEVEEGVKSEGKAMNGGTTSTSIPIDEKENDSKASKWRKRLEQNRSSRSLVETNESKLSARSPMSPQLDIYQEDTSHDLNWIVETIHADENGNENIQINLVVQTPTSPPPSPPTSTTGESDDNENPNYSLYVEPPTSPSPQPLSFDELVAEEEDHLVDYDDKAANLNSCVFYEPYSPLKKVPVYKSWENEKGAPHLLFGETDENEQKPVLDNWENEHESEENEVDEEPEVDRYAIPKQVEVFENEPQTPLVSSSCRQYEEEEALLSPNSPGQSNAIVIDKVVEPPMILREYDDGTAAAMLLPGPSSMRRSLYSDPIKVQEEKKEDQSLFPSSPQDWYATNQGSLPNTPSTHSHWSSLNQAFDDYNTAISELSNFLPNQTLALPDLSPSKLPNQQDMVSRMDYDSLAMELTEAKKALGIMKGIVQEKDDMIIALREMLDKMHSGKTRKRASDANELYEEGEKLLTDSLIHDIRRKNRNIQLLKKSLGDDIQSSATLAKSPVPESIKEKRKKKRELEALRAQHKKNTNES